ncbi:hypothetical protein A2210_02470 [Candidatus Woesebacteria bacterium RIFOXYA1_FULL_40_18]|uniref:Uncharacterized protein n=1 Tax=Candidatus Woesebacteria bacterium RIFOXYA1_FULL_40_18 TaxID=1802532 RepID=A0A1F8CJV0_9BACT|nr:MAG: hypothetical protein A2210_02470 [Candidatus Woesebacteria bacterium RIFOXYA1_FULL_40_18]
MKNDKNTNIWANLLGKVQVFWSWLKADRRRLVGAAVTALLLASSIWYLVSRGNKNEVTYQTMAVTKGTIVSTVSASGQILTSNLVNVSTQATGVVKAVYVKNGDKVYAGQKIAEITLDSDGTLANAKAWTSLVSAQNGVNSANNSYRSTQASLQKVYEDIKGHDSDETLAQKETRTKAEVSNDNAYDQLKSAQANLASAGLSYRQSSPVITAPMTGTVDNITLASGMVLSNSSSSTTALSSNRIAVITSQANPIATFTVSEVDVSRVRQGQKATITLDSISDKTFTGKVLTVDKIGTVSSGVTNYPVVIGFDTSTPEILPNMAVTANIILQTKTDILIVPSSAITSQNGEYIAKTLKNGQEVDVAVEVGISSDTQTEIVLGLSEGEIVITGTVIGTTSSSTQTRSVFSGGGFGGGGAVRIAR